MKLYKGIHYLKITSYQYDSFEVHFKFDFYKINREYIKECAMFWFGSRLLLKKYKGDHVQVFLSQTADACLSKFLRDLSKEQVIKEFDDMEGFLPLDGSCGIELIKLNTLAEHEKDDFLIQEYQV